jgi:chromosome partitioning protein
MNKIIVIAHQKGGVGKSTIASNLATELSKMFKVDVVDLDLQKSLTYYNNLRLNSGLESLNIINIDSTNELKSLINNNKNLLVIDAGGYDSDVNRVAISGADFIITPVSDSGIELVGLLSFRGILRDIRKHRPDLTANVLLNKIHARAGNSSLNEIHSFIDSNPEFNKLNSILRDRTDYKRAFDSGKSVIEFNFNDKAVKEMNDLIKEVISNGKN